MSGRPGRLPHHTWTDELYDQAVAYLRGQPLPSSWSKSVKQKFRRRVHQYYLDGDAVVLRPDRRPEDAVADRFVVVPPRRHAALLNEIMRNPATAQLSRDGLFDKVRRLGHLGISRSEVARYFERNPTTSYVGWKDAPRRVAEASYRPQFPNEHWQMDLIIMDAPELRRANSGYKYILTVIDVFSKYVWLKPCKQKESDEIAAHLYTIFLNGDIPRKLQSDRGTEFMGTVARVCRQFHVRRIINDAYSPRTNGVVENFNKHVKRHIAHHFNTYVDDPDQNPTKRYVDILDRIAFNFNNVARRPSRMSPFQVHRGTKVTISVEARGLPTVSDAPILDVPTTVEGRARRFEAQTRNVRTTLHREAARRERAVEASATTFRAGAFVRIRVAQTVSPGSYQMVPIRVGGTRRRARGLVPTLDLFPFAPALADAFHRGVFKIKSTRSTESRTVYYQLVDARTDKTVERLRDSNPDRWTKDFVASMLIPASTDEMERRRPVRPSYPGPIDVSVPMPLVVPREQSYQTLSIPEVKRILESPARMRGRRIRQYWRMEPSGTLQTFAGTVRKKDGPSSWEIVYDDQPGVYRLPLRPEQYDKREHEGWVFLG